MTKLAFNLATGADTGGAAIRSVEAFAAQAGPLGPTDWVVRSMVASQNYIAYPTDLSYSKPELEDFYDKADVIHLNHTMHGHTWYDAGQHKPVVLEHHGMHEGSFDVNLEQSIAQGVSLGAVQVGSTANLELFGTKNTVIWAPIPYNQQFLADLRAKHMKTGVPGRDRPFRVAHAPTNREIKSTDVFVAALSSLKAKGVNVEGVLIEKRPHAECLALKASADLLVDQLILGYGCNAIEAWGMGLAVVGGIAYPGWREPMAARWGGMPLVEATKNDLASVIFDLIASPDLRAEYEEKGREHFEKWHTQQFHVAQMSDLYESAKPTKTGLAGFTKRWRMPGQPKRALRDVRAERLARLALRGKF